MWAGWREEELKWRCDLSLLSLQEGEFLPNASPSSAGAVRGACVPMHGQTTEAVAVLETRKRQQRRILVLPMEGRLLPVLPGLALHRSCPRFASNVPVRSPPAEAGAPCQHSFQRASVAKITPFLWFCQTSGLDGAFSLLLDLSTFPRVVSAPAKGCDQSFKLPSTEFSCPRCRKNYQDSGPRGNQSTDVLHWDERRKKASGWHHEGNGSLHPNAGLNEARFDGWAGCLRFLVLLHFTRLDCRPAAHNPRLCYLWESRFGDDIM